MLLLFYPNLNLVHPIELGSLSAASFFLNFEMNGTFYWIYNMYVNIHYCIPCI